MQPEAKPAATRRILTAARTLLARGGAAEVSIGDVAAEAGVSKALVHYHFHDKDSLLLAVVEHVGTAVVARERDAVDRGHIGHPLDGYWAWLDGELQLGDLRILLSLAEYHSERVRNAARRVAEQRREVAAEHVSLLFERLDLTPRVPAALIAETVTAFIDGLAAASALDGAPHPRPAFDVLWLALLTLAD